MYIKYISLFITLLIGLVKAELPAVLNGINKFKLFLYITCITLNT